MNKSLAVMAIATLIASSSSLVLAHGGKYVIGGDGNVVRDGFGNCVKTPLHGLELEECEPETLTKTTINEEPNKQEPQYSALAVTEPAVVEEPLSVKEELKPQRIEERMTLAGDATFETNSDVMTEVGKNSLDKLVLSLKDTSLESINLYGHADSRGSDSYNQVLSERRAEAVKNYLIDRGLDGSNISTYGRGESEPVASNDTAGGRAKNRRVELSISATKVSYQ